MYRSKRMIQLKIQSLVDPGPSQIDGQCLEKTKTMKMKMKKKQINRQNTGRLEMKKEPFQTRQTKNMSKRKSLNSRALRLRRMLHRCFNACDCKMASTLSGFSCRWTPERIESRSFRREKLRVLREVSSSSATTDGLS